ncbi:MAG: thiolase family protein [Rhodanobacter sp.]|jgi:acetyl-CoA C-acetyltransferase|nr:thiolase family protein [Rhodanobacter sp.]
MSDIIIAGAKRTAIGSMLGQFTGVSAVTLGSTAIKAAVAQARVAPDTVSEVIMGCVLQANVGQGPGRQAAIAAGLPMSAGCTTINKLCGSGMKAIMLAHDLIRAGSADILVAGGMESMTNAPHMVYARTGLRYGDAKLLDHMSTDGLNSPYDGKAMGVFADATAVKYGFTREDMDKFAIESVKRAQAAIASGAFVDEIVPVKVATRKGDVEYATDEQPGKSDISKISTLKPAFAKDGRVTAASSSSISDGAAATVVMSADTAKKQNITPLARIVGHATHSQEPEWFTLAPVGAIDKLLKKIGWKVGDIDVFEVNEAFAPVAMAPMKDLGIPHDKLNLNGGACALGHPIGASGARLIVTLIHALKRRGGKRGIAALCIGGGEATAMAIELV